MRNIKQGKNAKIFKMFPNLCFYQLKIDIIYIYVYTYTRTVYITLTPAHRHSSMVWKQMILLRQHQKVSSSQHFITIPVSLASLHLIIQTFYHLITRSIQYNKILRETDDINITLIVVYGYNSSILLLIVYFLMCLIYRLNFTIGMYV